MKSSTFNKTFEQIFTPERIAYAAQKAGVTIDPGALFDFAPHRSFLLPKNDGEFRTISIPDQKAKIIQRILADELAAHLKFSDRNYAYQKSKSPLKAINRVKHILTRYDFIIRADIDSFFDTIDHDRLLDKLRKIIVDTKIIYLIALFLKNGALFRNQWIDKLEGIYQGDVLSPLLANIYLHAFDISLEKRQIEFVRFADDMIFFTHTTKEAHKILDFVKQRLAIDKLALNDKKTIITHKSRPFEYLGVKFDALNHRYAIDNDRLMQKISKISKETKNLTLPQTVEKLNEHIRGFSNYYLKIINDTRQLELLQRRADEIIIKKIIQAKLQKTITQKRRFQQILEPLLSYLPRQNHTYELIQKAYEELKALTPVKSARQKAENQKRQFYKNYLKSTELIITKMGTHLSFARGRIKIRTPNEPLRHIPFNKVERIIVATTYSSISTYLIKQCAKRGIDIDFIENDAPFALLTYHKSISKELHLNQLKIILSPKGLAYAKALHYAKAKNQLNLLKYFNLRRKDEKIELYISKIQSLIPKIKNIADSKALLALEGQISQLYWNGFRIIIEVPHFQRTHKDSTDPVNQALNYGYAMLYNRIQSALIKEGLNIFYSFLHAVDYKNPTLVFDMIEPFRQPIVDREIVSILTKKQKIIQKNGRLDEKSKKLIIQNIQERLSSFTRSKYGRTTYLNIIKQEANSLKRAIENLEPKHSFFIAKY